jgi:hypothetical protein
VPIEEGNIIKFFLSSHRLPANKISNSIPENFFAKSFRVADADYAVYLGSPFYKPFKPVR